MAHERLTINRSARFDRSTDRVLRRLAFLERRKIASMMRVAVLEAAERRGIFIEPQGAREAQHATTE